MIPWINQRLMSEDPDSQNYLFCGTSPAYSLVTLLQEIQPHAKKNLVVMIPPRSVVFYGNESGLYLFREGSRVPFASFVIGGTELQSVRFRYNDPMDPNSGKRKEHQILSGWQGTAELLASAMQQSKTWKNLETIETESWYDRHAGVDFKIYTVWATPREDLTFRWNASEPKALSRFVSGKVMFPRNKPVVLASVEVIIDAHGNECVLSTQPYPELKGSRPDDYGQIRRSWRYHNDSWNYLLETEEVPQPTQPVPILVDLSDQYMTRLRPHDDFEINWQ